MLALGCSLVRSKRLFLRPDLPLSRRRARAVSNPPSSAGPEPRAAPAWGRAWRGPTICHGRGVAPRYGHDVVARRSVTAVSQRRLHRGDGLQIEIDHLLKRVGGGTVAQAFGQCLEPRGAFGLDREQYGQRVVPALRPASPRCRLWGFGGERRSKRQHFGAMARLALGIAQRGGTFGQTATGQRVSPLRNDEPMGQPAALKRAS